ncbi:PIN domain-like protein [Gymnopus androsaceus JB14]|uniref:PIN domain-like protein n=1 Tax=Gymnopus androsaceus JB14 TaxID=1447944 RepID=A0A6A4GUD1_9AGAR|nr:PIN domain-like protein [Gymnopus androsaceus JB14]
MSGLWPFLEPAQSATTLTALFLTKFETASRGFRIGIDTSIWFFHAGYSKEGENPELRLLFFRCAQLLRQGFLPLFVFDGPKRPDFKRGRIINRAANKLEPGMKHIIEAFGFEYRTAPGEAEAELAFLNRTGIIDGVLSDDVDTFLFGANLVIRNRSSTHPDAKSTVEKAQIFTYTLPHPSFPDLGHEDLIFIALCSSGDYGVGLGNYGIQILHGLARAGFGKSLCEAAINHPKDSPQLDNFLRQWREQLSQELKTNSSGFLPHKLSEFACITSETSGRSELYNDLMVTNGGQHGWLRKDPSLPMLAEVCECYGFMDNVIKQFRTVIFEGVTLRIMRRAALLRQSQAFDASTISLEHIRSHFSSINFTPENGNSPCPTFIKDISMTRTHESTSKTLEYRVAVDPTILVQLTASGVKGTRPNDKNEPPKKKNEYPDPTLPLKLWIPAVLVREAVPGVIEAYEEFQRRKEEKKAGKGKKTEFSSAKARPSLPSSSSVASPTTDIRLFFNASKPSALRKGKQRASIHHADSTLLPSLEWNRKNPFNDNTAFPPQMASPRKMSSLEDESSEGVLVKSPRRSKDHTYAKELDSAITGKTIRDTAQHPSRTRDAPPTPMNRAPLRSTSPPSQIGRNDLMLQPTGALKDPRPISDSGRD